MGKAMEELDGHDRADDDLETSLDKSGFKVK